MAPKPKSRTSNNKLSKKVGIPRWVIAIVLLVVAVTGGFLVYKSFASNGSAENMSYRNCSRSLNKCFYSSPSGTTLTAVHVVPDYSGTCARYGTAEFWSWSGKRQTWHCMLP